MIVPVRSNSSLHGGGAGVHKGVLCVELFKMFVARDEFFHETIPFDRLSLVCWRAVDLVCYCSST